MLEAIHPSTPMILENAASPKFRAIEGNCFWKSLLFSHSWWIWLLCHHSDMTAREMNTTKNSLRLLNWESFRFWYLTRGGFLDSLQWFTNFDSLLILIEVAISHYVIQHVFVLLITWSESHCNEQKCAISNRLKLHMLAYKRLMSWTWCGFLYFDSIIFLKVLFQRGSAIYVRWCCSLYVFYV